jgi:hypothetical protein
MIRSKTDLTRKRRFVRKSNKLFYYLIGFACGIFVSIVLFIILLGLIL